MNWSKGWGDNPERALPEDDPEFRRRLWRILAVSLLAVALAIALPTAWRLLPDPGEPLLNQARAVVQAARNDPAESLAELREAESLLREYLQGRATQHDAARLLLSATLTLRGVYDHDQRIGDANEIEKLLHQIRPAACSLEDLLTAIDIFRHCGKPAQADWLTDPALYRSQDTPEHADILWLAVRLRYDLGREQKVLEHCRQLAEMDPSDPEPWRWMAMVHEDGGYDESLMEALQNVLERDEAGAADDRRKLVDTLITLGERAAAREQFDLLQRQIPDLIDRRPLIYARLLMLEGDTATATEILEQILEDDPEATTAMLVRSRLLLSQNRLPEAETLLRRLLDLDPMNFHAHYVLGQVSARQGERDRAEHHLALHQKILDTRVRIHTLERRAGRNPHDSEARTELIHLYEQLDMNAHAEFWRRAGGTGASAASW